MRCGIPSPRTLRCAALHSCRYATPLGHASIQQTEVYARLMPEGDASAMALLDAPPPAQKVRSRGRK
jgi:hypothetical protein